MKKIITFVFVISFITNFAQTGQKNFIDVNYIEVTGKAEMEIVPNEIFLEISNIIIDKINHSEIQKFRSEVKVNAIQAAKSKATSLANAIDQSIGKAIFIQEIENIYLGGQVAGLSNIVVTSYAIRIEKEEVTPIIEFEKIKLEYSILARFELK